MMMKAICVMAVLAASNGSAFAATIKAVYSGTVTGVSRNGESPDYSDQTGQAFTTTYIYDTEMGNRDTTMDNDRFIDLLSGGPFTNVPNPSISAQFQVGDLIVDINPDNTFNAQIDKMVGGNTYFHPAISSFTTDPTYIYFQNGLGFPAFDPPNLLDTPFSVIDIPDFGGNGQFAIGRVSGDHLDYLTAYSLSATTFTISLVSDDPAPSPVPVAGALLLGALAALRLLRRRQQAA